MFQPILLTSIAILVVEQLITMTQAILCGFPGWSHALSVRIWHKEIGFSLDIVIILPCYFLEIEKKIQRGAVALVVNPLMAKYN